MSDSRTEHAERAAKAGRGWSMVAAVSIALALVVVVIHVADASLLAMEADQPGFLAHVDRKLMSGLAVLWAGFGALVLCRQRANARALLLLLLVAAAGTRAGAWLMPAAGHGEAGLEVLQTHLEIDPEAWAHAAFSLGRRVALQVAEDERVAIVHPRVQPDFPLFLAYALCPRIFFAFAEDEPDAGVVRELKIDWILDVRQASANRGYRNAELRRAQR